VRACAALFRPVDRFPADRCGKLNLIHGWRQWTGEQRAYDGRQRPFGF
jgi:hypothetical protein